MFSDKIDFFIFGFKNVIDDDDNISLNFCSHGFHMFGGPIHMFKWPSKRLLFN